MNVKLSGETRKEGQLLTWDLIDPNIPELYGKMITSIRLDVDGGEVAKAVIKYRSPDNIANENEIQLSLTKLFLDFDAEENSREIKWIGSP